MNRRIPCWCLLACGLPAVAHAQLPPLEPATRELLATTVDDEDGPDPAFAWLAGEATEQVPSPRRATSAATPSTTEWTAWIEAPEAHRGREVVVAGRVEQVTELPPGWDGFAESFLRLPDGGLVAVLAPTDDALRVGTRVRVLGRFYKRLAATSRDGVARRYPAVVARRLPPSGARPGSSLVGGAVLGLGLLWWILRRAAARSRRATDASRPSGPVQRGAPGTRGNREELPEDPAAALEVLRSRNDHRPQGGHS